MGWSDYYKSSLSGVVAILFSKAFLPISCQIEEIVEGRLLKLKVMFENHSMVFLNVYAPTKGSERVLFFS